MLSIYELYSNSVSPAIPKVVIGFQSPMVKQRYKNDMRNLKRKPRQLQKSFNLSKSEPNNVRDLKATTADQNEDQQS